MIFRINVVVGRRPKRAGPTLHFGNSDSRTSRVEQSVSGCSTFRSLHFALVTLHFSTGCGPTIYCLSRPELHRLQAFHDHQVGLEFRVIGSFAFEAH